MLALFFTISFLPLQVWAVRYNHDGTHLLSVGADHSILVYSVPRYSK